MIDLERKIIQIGSQEHPIVRCEVWFRIPTGLTSDLNIAISRCQQLEFDPKTCIVAIPVAIATEHIYEEFTR